MSMGRQRRSTAGSLVPTNGLLRELQFDPDSSSKRTANDAQLSLECPNELVVEC